MMWPQKSRVRELEIALEDNVAKYGLKPIALGLFGGVIDYNKMGFIARKGMDFFRPQLEKAGFVKVAPDVYDLRDWDEIRNWTNSDLDLNAA